MDGKYILKGKATVPCEDLIEWARWYEQAARDGSRRVASWEKDGVRVSTVFLAIDHRFDGGPPLLFETMVFGGPLDNEQERYTTWAEAEAGHAAMVARVSEPELIPNRP